MLNQKYPTRFSFKIKDEIQTFSEKQEQKITCQQNFPY